MLLTDYRGSAEGEALEFFLSIPVKWHILMCTFVSMAHTVFHITHQLAYSLRSSAVYVN